MTKRVAILISGGGSNMVALAESMVGDHPARPCLVISNIPEAGGLAKAESFDIPTMCVNHRKYDDRAGFEAELLDTLSYYTPDIICLAGFMRILSPDFVAHWEGRILNIHPSLLPLYKGLNTHARAIEAGEGARRGSTINEKAEGWAFKISEYDWSDFTPRVSSIVRPKPQAVTPPTPVPNQP